MSAHATLLAISADCWRLVRAAGAAAKVHEVPLGDPPDAARAAARVAEMLTQWGCDGQVTLGLPAGMVLSAGIDCGDLPRRDRRSAMIYRLEEKLPVEAERFTADFATAPSGRAFGVAAITEPVLAVIEQLTHAGVRVAAVCPTALLTLWACTHNGAAAKYDYAVLADGESVDVFRMEAGAPMAWYNCPPGADRVVQRIKADLLARPAGEDQPKVTVFGSIEDRIVVALRERVTTELHVDRETDLLASAAEAAGALLAGRGGGWVDLRRDALAEASPWAPVGRLVRSATVLLVVLLVTLTAGLQWRALRYAAAAEASRSRQVELFRELAPHSAVPTNVASRLRSEAAKVANLSGQSGELPVRPSALDTLNECVAALPADVRLCFTRVQVGPNGLILEGQLRSHGDAEAVAAALAAAGFAMDPPRSEAASAGGVSFTLTGTAPAEVLLAGGGR